MADHHMAATDVTVAARPATATPGSPPSLGPVRRVSVVVIISFVVLCASCSGNGLSARASKRSTTTTTKAPASSSTTTQPGPTTTTAPETAPADSGFPDGWTPQPLQWATCKSHAGFQCATLEVPLDWSQPQGPQISLAVARQRATGARIGSLVANPGGPGASGLDFLFDQPFKAALRQRFDLVSWDPRGVGLSTHLQCGSAVKPFLHLDPSPDNPAEQQAIDTAAMAVAQQCANNPADATLMPHLGTDDTARDLEALRLALGDPKLTYYGFSYGTYIGERYLALFPTHVRALVLDGVVSPTEDLPSLLGGQTTAMTAAIGRAIASCHQDASCSLKNPQSTYDQVAAKVETTPLPTGTSRPLGPAELATGAIYATYDPQLWPSLNTAVAQAASGDGSDMSQLADGYYDIGDWTAYADITCVDMNHPVGAAAYKTFVDGLVAQSADFGGSIGNEMLPCAFWPTPSQPHTDPIPATQSPDILVVGNTGDAATPYQDAQYVSTMLAHGHLITYHGQGHTSYGRDDCIDAAIHAYLINLTIPKTDPQCGGSAALPSP